MNKTLVVVALLLSAGCTTTPPKNPENLCDIFREKKDWYKEAKASEKRWKSPIPIMMSTMYQESAYNAKALPPKAYKLGFIPWGRVSSSYGYSQAQVGTWDWYEKSSGDSGDRDDFGDSIQFIGWYNSVSTGTNKIAHTDAENLYLAYHEGHGGFKRKTYLKKNWLMDTAKRVDKRSQRYSQQLAGCKEELDKEGFWSWLF
jgi:hypothetical protein